MRIQHALFSLVFILLVGASPLHAAPISAAARCLPPDLKQRLADVQQRFGPVRIISTHRPSAVIAGTGRRSKHADCRAVDFAAPAGKHTQITSWLKVNHNGGVGTYSCGMNHIHIDNGPRARWHRCVGGRRR